MFNNNTFPENVDKNVNIYKHWFQNLKLIFLKVENLLDKNIF